ncbi:MAG: RNA-guided pseudouridylation complex pseudouridine synthase subunit Cbf5 [Candidatus Aenigmarchaeota archaeon]|nr:RNA-guided pseudouridylation complex pseudouridine synthase subunit Cbf5 [Candidatus Aenigmarchaeota archaeon]
MWYVKVEDEETDPRYGKPPEERTIEELIKSSVVNVDKPKGPTSHQVTAWVKDIFKVKKAGHAGTLDPKVTGVLPVALENATKAMMVLMGLDKEYVGVMHLHKDVDIETLRKVIAEKFVGKIKQIPPVKSAVARRPRVRTVYFFDVLEKEGKDVLFRVGCEAGTYIRKLVHDLGVVLGVGAHMTELRRVRAGHFKEQYSHSLVEIRDAYEFWKEEGEEKYLRKILIPVEYAILHVKRVFVKDAAISAIAHGAPVYVPGLVRIQKGIQKGEKVAIYSLKNELVAIGIANMTSEEMFEKKHGIAVRVDRVFIGKDVYPKSWK